MKKFFSIVLILSLLIFLFSSSAYANLNQNFKSTSVSKSNSPDAAHNISSSMAEKDEAFFEILKEKASKDEINAYVKKMLSEDVKKDSFTSTSQSYTAIQLKKTEENPLSIAQDDTIIYEARAEVGFWYSIPFSYGWALSTSSVPINYIYAKAELYFDGYLIDSDIVDNIGHGDSNHAEAVVSVKSLPDSYAYTHTWHSYAHEGYESWNTELETDYLYK